MIFNTSLLKFLRVVNRAVMADVDDSPDFITPLLQELSWGMIIIDLSERLYMIQ